jgi:hypothetical protein
VGFEVPSNPYDARQMVDYLADNLSEAKSLIWTLNLELTPIYAIEPLGSFSRRSLCRFTGTAFRTSASRRQPQYIQRRQYSGADYWTHSTPVLRTSGSRH